MAKVDFEKAKKMRLLGSTYVEIAEAMPCSVVWCKKYLKGLVAQKVSDDKSSVDLVRDMGRTKFGVTSGEIKMIVLKNYPPMEKKEIAEKVSAIKKAARRGNEDVIVRPYWMLPDCAQDCTNTMMDMAQDLHERQQELSTKYRKLYDLDESYQNSVAYYLSVLSAGNYTALMPQGLAKYGEQLQGIVEHLEARNTQSIPCAYSIKGLHSTLSESLSKGFKNPEVVSLVEIDEEGLAY
jgi:hypothetical protein